MLGGVPMLRVPVVTIACVLGLSGCLADLAVAVGSKVVEKVLEEGPTRVEGKIVVSEAVNPDEQDRSSPVVVRIYELKNDSAFMSADFFSLFDDDEAALGEDLVNREEFQLAPGSVLTFEREFKEGSRFIGVMAAYQRLYESTWRVALELPPHETSELELDIGRLEVAILTEDQIEQRDEQAEESEKADSLEVPAVGAAPEPPAVPAPPSAPPLPGAGDIGGTGGVTP